MGNCEAYHPLKKQGFYLDPRTKIILMGIISTLLFFVHNDILFLTVLTVIPLVLLITNKQYKIATIYGILFCLGVLAELYKNSLQLPQILNFIIILLVALVIRLFPTFMMGYYIIESTKVSEFITAMQRTGISEKLIIPITVIFRFVPTIAEESRAISDAMRMREIQFGSKKFWKNPTALLEYRVIPLMMSIAKIGDELSAAALTRGLGSPTKRTNITVVGFGVYDALFFTIAIVLVVWGLV